MSVNTTNLKSYEDYKNKIQEILNETYELSNNNPSSLRDFPLDMVTDKETKEKVERFKQLEKDNLFLISKALTNKLKDKYLLFENTAYDSLNTLFIVDNYDVLIAKPNFFPKYNPMNTLTFVTDYFAINCKDDPFSLVRANTHNNENFIFYNKIEEFIKQSSIDDFFNYFEDKIITKEQFIEKFLEISKHITELI